ncbi:hypothetical protein BaRGS_00015593 [Batillaria attramentaria]|uniref:Uncharacterized protein n=1 Tax=Batillaria attramentaria TaxID=370345 RepID=A0ABD0L0Y6_9CAEN
MLLVEVDHSTQYFAMTDFQRTNATGSGSLTATVTIKKGIPRFRSAIDHEGYCACFHKGDKPHALSVTEGSRAEAGDLHSFSLMSCRFVSQLFRAAST